MLDAFGKSGFDVFAGSEVFLLDNMKNGGKGCITATGNINPGAINKVFENWQSPNAEVLQKDITATRGVVQKYPMMAALKAVIAHYGRDPDWATVRPPLVELTPAQSKSLIVELEGRGFDMPGLASASATATA
jgi:4-hydroxy-tetrahydrodipicolinate synthase